ncbi:MAG: BamA/TamA family outer membrane protein [Bacteroidota bacterium]
MTTFRNQREGLIFLFLVGFFSFPDLTAQPDSSNLPLKEKKKTGWTWAALPIIAYDADMGIQLGALGQMFYYGDGSTYPEYKHTIFAECSWFTKGSAAYQVFYDSKYLIPKGIRISVDLDYLPERALDFFGFNGYEANYNPDLITEGSPEYISRMFYKMERNMFRVMADFQGPITSQKFRWLAGVNVIGMGMGTVNISRFNKGKPEDKKLPDTALLYDEYVKYGLIGPDEKEGGITVILKTGLVFDTRDNEAAPERGLWSEILLLSAPTFAGNSPYAFIRLAVTHRQYISLVKNWLVAAYQLSYQGTAGGSSPFYILPYIYSSYSNTIKPDGLGGAKTLRGILRNRIVGDGVAFGNVELRWKFFKSVVMKQNLYLGLTAFLDGGMVATKRRIYTNTIPEDKQEMFFDSDKERLHLSAGLGLRIALNSNFILSVDYGRAFNSQDGTSGLYIGIGNIF